MEEESIENYMYRQCLERIIKINNKLLNDNLILKERDNLNQILHEAEFMRIETGIAFSLNYSAGVFAYDEWERLLNDIEMMLSNSLIERPPLYGNLYEISLRG